MSLTDDDIGTLRGLETAMWQTATRGDRSWMDAHLAPGVLAEAEYDLGIIMCEDPVELVAGDPWERAYRLAARTDRDATAIWEWGVVERVSTGLLATEVSLQPAGGQMLRAAEQVASGA